MKKLLLFFLFFIAILIGLMNAVMAKEVFCDDVIHLKYVSNIFNNKSPLIYPNPFSESTTIFYTPESDESISIKLYTDKGIFLNELFHEKVDEGKLYEFVLCSKKM